MKYLVSLEAEDDLEEATAYYESVSLEGGYRFLDRYAKAVQRILDAPRSLPKYVGPTRISLIARSVYGIVYIPSRETIRVVGVICLIRKPGYWKKRSKWYKSED